MSPVRKKTAASTSKKQSEVSTPYLQHQGLNRTRLNLHAEKAAAMLNKNQADVVQLLSMLENAKAPEDLNKFIHFDFPVTAKRFSDHLVAFLKLLDENGGFQVAFSKLHRSLHQWEAALVRAQSGVMELQLATVRKETFKEMLKSLKRLCGDLEEMSEAGKELDRLLCKRPIRTSDRSRLS